MSSTTFTSHTQVQMATSHTHWKQKVAVAEQLQKELDDMQRHLPTAVRDGPCEKSLEPVLRRHHIVRQEYHGGAFVGNHIAAALQETIIDEITSAPVNVTRERFQTEVAAAEVVAERYRSLLKKYSACRSLFNHSSPVTAEDLQQLQDKIALFMATLRREIVARKKGNVTPKLHLLEDHVVDQMRHFGAGLALRGEQGGETIHHEWNELDRRFSGVPDNLERLKLVAKAHATATLPSHKAKVPMVKRRAV